MQTKVPKISPKPPFFCTPELNQGAKNEKHETTGSCQLGFQLIDLVVKQGGG